MKPGTQKRQAQGRIPPELRRSPGSPGSADLERMPLRRSQRAPADTQARTAPPELGGSHLCEVPHFLHSVLAALTNTRRKQRALLSAPLSVKVAHSSGQPSHQNVTSLGNGSLSLKWYRKCNLSIIRDLISIFPFTMEAVFNSIKISFKLKFIS